MTAFPQFMFRLSKWLLLVSNWHTSSHCTISPALRAFLRSVWCQNCSHKICKRKTVHLLSFFVVILTIRVWVVRHMLRCNFPVNVFWLFVLVPINVSCFAWLITLTFLLDFAGYICLGSEWIPRSLFCNSFHKFNSVAWKWVPCSDL